MAQVTFKGNSVNTKGNLPKVGDSAPAFTLTKSDLADVSLNDFKGKKVVLNIFPSIDTPVCQASTRKFNEEVSKLENTAVVCISKDLPFAFGRFCGAEGIKNVITASEYKNSAFGDSYGVTITDSVLAGLLSRAVVVLDANHKVVYTEQVPDIAQEPNYEKAVAALKKPLTPKSSRIIEENYLGVLSFEKAGPLSLLLASSSKSVMISGPSVRVTYGESDSIHTLIGTSSPRTYYRRHSDYR